MLERVTAAIVRLALGALLLCIAPACFKSSPRVGSETHFMELCKSSCEGGDLSCICGVCTQSCKSDESCKDLAESASCMAVDEQSAACEGSKPPARSCEAKCKRDADCKALGSGFACTDGSCRQGVKTGVPRDDGAVADSGVKEPASDAGSNHDVQPPPREAPLVMLLVDTSGSMERKVSCKCTTPACVECLPDCSKGDHNRWISLLEVLAGTYDPYSCISTERTPENGATYDEGYFLPHFSPQGAPGPDGLIAAYESKMRFGLATFDGWDTWVGAPPLVTVEKFDEDKSERAEGLWSYNPSRVLGMDVRNPNGGLVGGIRYPNTTAEYFMDTGIRGPQAEQGGLLAAVEPDTALDTHRTIETSLRRVRPYGGTPIAASLDDVYYFLGRDPAMAKERSRAKRPYVVLITDGFPDDDYRSFGCDCATTEDPSSSDYCGGSPNDPSLMHCPYPTAEEGARILRCGEEQTCGAGPAERVYVVGLAIDDSDVSTKLDDIAAAGGAVQARFATNSASLRIELTAILDEIANAN